MIGPSDRTDDRMMRAAFVDQLGPAGNIRLGDLPLPTPGPTDVLVEVAATTVNPVDTFVRSGAYRTPTPFPFIVGRDLVGTVAEADPAWAPMSPSITGRMISPIGYGKPAISTSISTRRVGTISRLPLTCLRAAAASL